EVKSINRDFLSARRVQLRSILTRRIEALRKYQAGLGSALTMDENKVIENAISLLEGDLQDLGKKTSTNAARESASVASPTKVDLARDGASSGITAPSSAGGTLATPSSSGGRRPVLIRAQAQDLGAVGGNHLKRALQGYLQRCWAPSCPSWRRHRRDPRWWARLQKLTPALRSSKFSSLNLADRLPRDLWNFIYLCFHTWSDQTQGLIVTCELIKSFSLI